LDEAEALLGIKPFDSADGHELLQMGSRRGVGRSQRIITRQPAPSSTTIGHSG
jgi:hypothetical protein